MPNEVVDAIHRLAAASKQAGGINFTNENGKFITDEEEEEEENTTEDKPIPVLNSNNEENIYLISKETTSDDTDQAIAGVESQ